MQIPIKYFDRIIEGNILINGTKNDPIVVLLDHGLYTEIDDKTRTNYSGFWKALIE